MVMEHYQKLDKLQVNIVFDGKNTPSHTETFWEWQPCLSLYGALLTLKTIVLPKIYNNYNNIVV